VSATATRQLPGFHGDRYLIELADLLLGQADAFVETGANRGTTLRHVAERFPTLPCISCEPEPSAYAEALEHTRHLPNVALVPLRSQEFIDDVLRRESHLHDRTTVFWLDAHDHGFAWPLLEEVEFVTRTFRDPLILIDDFLVPGQPEFGFDAYDGQECSWDYVARAVVGEFQLWYPAYTQHTSAHHPLRGWGLLARPGRLAPPPNLARPARTRAPERKTVSVGFHGFWPEFAAGGLAARHPYLLDRYELVPAVEPDVVFYSIFSTDEPEPTHDHVRVFYSGEPVLPDLDRYDFAVSVARIDDPRHLYLPNFVPRLYATGFEPTDLLAPVEDRPLPSGFCSYVYRRSFPHREEIFRALSRLGRVDAPGGPFQNVPAIGDTVADKLAFLAGYRFTVAYENSGIPGYTSEKLVEARLAGTIPLYWGDPLVGEDFDTSSFVNRHEFPDDDSFLARVGELGRDDEAWRAMRARPFVRGNVLPRSMRPEPALEFFAQVFEQAGTGRDRHPARRNEPVRLHLGCGDERRDGWLDVDIDPDTQPDILASVESLPMLGDGSVDEIEACHLFEHLTYDQALAALREWHRVLRPGGLLQLELPNLDACVRMLGRNFDPQGYDIGLIGIFGYPPEIGLTPSSWSHQWGWTPETLEAALLDVGFREVEQVPITQTWRVAARYDRDMRLRARR
jgi:hypothetical protein